jgi:hypothetical protein
MIVEAAAVGDNNNRTYCTIGGWKIKCIQNVQYCRYSIKLSSDLFVIDYKNVACFLIGFFI